MSVAIFSKDTLKGEALEALLSRVGHFEVAGRTDDLATCINIVRDRSVRAVIVDEAGMTLESWSYLKGAQVVQAFSLVLLTEESCQTDDDTITTLSNYSTSRALFDLLESLDDSSKRGRRSRRAAPMAGSLTNRERQIFALVGRGLTNKQIAEETGLKEQSVKSMVSTLIRKLDCENRTQLAARGQSLDTGLEPVKPMVWIQERPAVWKMLGYLSILLKAASSSF